MPGVYRTPDDVNYFARLSGFGNELADIITNDAFAEGGSIFEIMDADVAFQTQGGATWSRIDDTPTLVRSASWGLVKVQFRDW